MLIELYDSNRLNFVEINITGDKNNYVRCDDDSKYIDTNVFVLFISCFENSNKKYEYFGPTKYSLKSILLLQDNLKETLEKLKNINTKEGLLIYIDNCTSGEKFISEISSCNKDWENNWEDILQKLVYIIIQIIEITTNCVEKSRVLWVVGY